MELKEIKQQFFTYRNGMLADRLREGGDPHTVIFGLNLPQIMDIARLAGKDKALACELWKNSGARESRLIAPMILPVESLTIDMAREWIASVENTEVADILCHKLLRNTDFAHTLCLDYAQSDNELLRYLAFRLAANLLAIGKDFDKATMTLAAHKELSKGCAITREPASLLIDE